VETRGGPRGEKIARVGERLNVREVEVQDPRRDARLTQSGKSSVDRNSEARRCGTGFQPVDFRTRFTGQKPVPQSKRAGGGGRKRSPRRMMTIPERDKTQGSTQRPVGLNTRLERQGTRRQAEPGSRASGHDLADFGRSGRAKGNGKRGEHPS